MRKLKTLLILMFAACLSFTLFACGGGDDDDDSGKSLNLLSGDQIELTDADTQDTFNTKMQTYKLTGRNDEGRVDILGSECDITGTINFGEIDRYTVTFKPRENNENGVTADVVVSIDHDWGAPDATGKEVCSHDGATRITKDEDIAIHYGGFHYGTGASTELGRDPNAETALPKVLLTEEQASNIGLHAENSTAAEFKDAAGINEGVTSSGRIKAFGKDERANKVVPTLTAGDLAPGMSITIEGYAKTDAGTDNTNPGGPWNVVNGNWNAPSYGIADPYSPLCTEANGGINVGTAVIVRSEGWVLYNGIGQEIKNTLGGLPKFIEGGKATESGSTEDSNCASWDRATKDFLTGQDVTNRPAYTSSDWKNWWVYSEGQDRHSLDSYQSFIHVRVTWSYRTYGEGDAQVGIIVIDSDYLDEGTTFRSYIKVPAATRGSYRTIIHGDYSTLLITKTAYVETETVTDMQVKGLKDGAVTEYLAGEQIDAGSVFDMQVKSEQNSAWHDGGIAVTNDMLYYYVGEGATYGEAEAAVETATDWEAVGDQPLTTDMKIFKLVLERADDTFHRMVPEAACNAIKITANNVAGAVGDEYSTNLNSRDPMAAYTRALGKGEGEARYVDLTITKALFRAIPSEEAGSGHTFDGLTNTEGYLFTAIRILGIGEFGEITGEQKKSGTVNEETYYYTFKPKDGNDVLLVVAIKETMLGKPLTIDGVQNTDIRITFGTGSLGFKVTSSVSGNKPTLNAGGEVTIEYVGLSSGTNYSFALRAGDTQYGTANTETLAALAGTDGTISAENQKNTALGTSGVTVTYYKVEGTKTTITFQFPAFDFATWTTMPYIRVGSGLQTLAEDYIEYDLAFTATAGSETAANQSEGGAYFYAKDGTLYFVTVAKKITTAGEKANLSDITGGITANINSGSADTAKSFNLGYKYSAGTLAFADESLGDGCALKTIILEKAYGDYGVIAVASVDIAKATGFAGDFGFQIGGVATNNGHYWKYNATDKKIEYAKIEGAGGKTVITPGDCYTTGIVASEVKDDDKTVFLAEYTEVGGQHEDKVGGAEGGDGICDLCGATITKDVVMKDWGDGYTGAAYTITPGTIIDVEGSLKDSGITDVGGNFGPFVSILMSNGKNGNARYWLRTDGWIVCHPTDGWEGDAAIDEGPGNVEANNTPVLNQNFYTSLAYNTLNGAQTTDGTAIDTATLGDYLAGKSFRYIVSFIGTTIKVEFNYYNPDGTLSLSYYVEIRNVTVTSATVQFISDELTFLKNDGKITVAESTVNKSVIDEVEAADVTVPGTGSGTTHTAPANVTFATAGFDADGNAKITATGMAAKQDKTYYIAFRVTFSQALADTTTPALFQADGTAAYADGYVNLNPARTELSVYVPVKATTGSFLIKFTNFKASTMQSDIVVDLGALGVSDVGATLTATGLNLGESTFTIEYTGVQGTDKLVIGDTEKALSEIGPTDVDLGNGLKVKAAQAFSGTGAKLTFTKAAADLTKAIPGYEIRLMRGTALVAINEVAPATKPAGDTKIDKSDWYARANGTTLYLYANKTSVDSLPFNVNAGHETDVDKLGVADLGFKVEGGVVKFENYSTLRSAITAVYTENGTENSLTVFVIDLTGLGVEAATPYGFAIEDSSDKTDKYYTVDADRAIAEAVSNLSEAADTVVKEHTATENGITARLPSGDKDTATYYGYVGVKGHTFPEGGGECTSSGCDAVGWQVSDVKVGKTNNSVNLGTTGEHGDQKSYNPDPTATFHVLVQGMTIVAEGELTSSTAANENGIGAYLYPATQTTHDWDFFRIDNWNNIAGSGSAQDQTKGVVEAWKFNIAKKTSVTGATNDWATICQIKANAHIVVTWDWTAEKTIVLTITITNPDMGATYTNTYTITSSAEGGNFEQTKYAIGLVPVLGSFTGSIMAYGPASVGAGQDSCNPQLHTHVYDPQTDRCTCGALKPDHNHDYNLAGDKVASGNVYCKCGELNPNHTHEYTAYYVCKYCGNVELTSLEAVETTDANIPTTDFGVGDWWGNNANTKVSASSGNFFYKFTFGCGTCNGHTGVLEALLDAPGDYGNGYFDFRADNETIWGGAVEATSTAHSDTPILKTFGTQPEYAEDVTYVVYAYRIDTTFVVCYQILKTSTVQWTGVVVVTNFPTGSLRIGIGGYTSGMTNLKAYSGTLAAKDVD